VADKIPQFTLGGINLGLTPSISSGSLILLLIPVLTFVTYFATSKLNRKLISPPITSGGVEDRQVACSNTMMDITMPAMSTMFTFMVPALVGVYWLFRSIVSFGKQFIISRIMPLPKFTEEDYKAAAKEMAGKRPVKKSENVGKVRSLHYIDDEDFEDTRDRALARKAALEEQEKAAQKNAKTPLEAAPVKEENPNKKDKEDKTADKE
jgi:membrane protein insertase Oxa1/YidC/SpoIIIJ